MGNCPSFCMGRKYMCTISFKERVRDAAIKNAPVYENVFMKYEYLVCSEAFADGCHIIKADKGNYLHLLGIHTALKPGDFFDKCIAGGEHQLSENDFDFNKPGRSEKSVKGSVRQKITALPKMLGLFQQKLLAEDGFKKNEVECAFATTDNIFTLGFASSGRPKSLLKGNELDKNKQKDVDLVFRKARGSSSKYKELIYGNKEYAIKYKDSIKDFIEPDFFKG